MNRTFARGRASLLATSMFATSVMVGAGALVGSVVLTPGVAVAGTCSNVQPGTFPATPAADSGNEVCVGGFSGISYSATGNLHVTLGNATIGSAVGPQAGVFIESFGPNNLAFVVDTSGVNSGSIFNGNGTGIVLQTTGAGTVTIDTGNSTAHSGADVFGADNGIAAFAATGAINIHTAGTTTGNFGEGILTNSGGPVTIDTTGQTTTTTVAPSPPGSPITPTTSGQSASGSGSSPRPSSSPGFVGRIVQTLEFWR